MLYDVELWGNRDTGKGELAGGLVHRVSFLPHLLSVRSGTPTRRERKNTPWGVIDEQISMDQWVIFVELLGPHSRGPAI